MSTKRPNIEDVSKLAGRSRATVDRVLNDRPGVSAKSRSAVEDAIAALGFAPDALRRRALKPVTSLRVLTSRGINPFFQEIDKGISHAVENYKSKTVKVSFDGFDPYAPELAVKRLRQVPEGTDCVITVGFDTPQMEDAINALVDRGIRVLTIVSDVPRSRRAVYVGQDNFAAGKTAGRLMCEALRNTCGEVAVLIGHLQFRHLLDRQSGFQKFLGLKRPDLSLVLTRPYGTDYEASKELISNIRQTSPQGIYLCGGGQPSLIEELAELGPKRPVVIGHEVTEYSRNALLDETFNLVIAHDVYEVGRKAVALAIDPQSNEDPFCSLNLYVPENLPPR